MVKELIYSLTKKDFIVQHFKGSGPGGQHKNKNATAVRIIHPASGARAENQEQKSQRQNRKLAFERLIKTKKFQLWHKRKVAESLLDKEAIDKNIEEWMKQENLIIEYFEEGK